MSSPPTPSPQLPRCPNCAMFFVNNRSLDCHLKMYCQRAPSSLELSRLRSCEPHSKRIGIQIRKVYKTDGGSVVLSTDDSLEDTRSPVKLNLVDSNGFNTRTTKSPSKQTLSPSNVQAKLKYINSDGPISVIRINREIHKFCNFSKFTCKLCRQKFSSTTSLKRHSASHLSWTRYACSICGLREFNHFKTRKHIIIDHNILPSNVDRYFSKVHYFNAPFRKDVQKHIPPDIERIYLDSAKEQASPTKEYSTLDIDIKEEVEEASDEAQDENEAEAEADEKNKELQSEASLLQILTQNQCSSNTSPVSETRNASTSSKSPQMLTLKLKRIQIDSIIPTELDVRKPDPTNLAKSKTLDSIIKTITVSSISRSKSMPIAEESSTDVKNMCEALVKSPAKSGLSSRERRLVRPPAKRQFPDTIPTFTGNAEKKQALEHAKSGEPVTKNKESTTKSSLRGNVSTVQPIENKSELSKDSNRMSGKKFKISLPGLMRKSGENGYGKCLPRGSKE